MALKSSVRWMMDDGGGRGADEGADGAGRTWVGGLGDGSRDRTRSASSSFAGSSADSGRRSCSITQEFFRRFLVFALRVLKSVVFTLSSLSGRRIFQAYNGAYFRCFVNLHVCFYSHLCISVFAYYFIFIFVRGCWPSGKVRYPPPQR